MTILERSQSYDLSGGSHDAVALDDRRIEDRVERQWFSCDIPRSVLKQLMRRSDVEGFRNFGPWLVLLIASGYGGYLSWGTWWALPAFFVYGTLYTSSDAHWHECSHGTAFRTRWINEFLYHALSFMTLREAYLWRWSHARHHTYTIIVGRDPEIGVPRPVKLIPIIGDFFYFFSGASELKKFILHACGFVTAGARDFVPPGEQGKMIWSSRAYVAIILGVGVWSMAIGSVLPMMYIALPRFYAAWLHQLFVLTQHSGLAESVHDHRLNTRTLYLNPLFRFLYVNMNYHIEHHMFPMVPFHALPRLHAEIKNQLPPTYSGLLDVYRELIPALLRQARDPHYFIHRPLPGDTRAVA